MAEEVTAWLHIHECVVNSGILFRIWRSKFLFGYKTVGSRIIMKNCLMMPNIGIWEMRITVPYEKIADGL